MNKLDCPIVRDLLPLYVDQAVSPETAQAVDAHLEDCPDCRREYESLTAHLPETLPEETDTSRQFGDFIKKVKRNESLKTGLIISLLLAVLLAIFLWQPPRVKDNDDVTFYRIYQTKDEEGRPSLFFVYSAPMYNSSSSATYGEHEEDGKTILQIDFDRPIIYGTPDSTSEGAMCVPHAEIDEVHLGDQVIWTREANGDSPVPEYVSAYIDAEQKYYFTFELNGKENFTDYPAPFIAVDYPDGRQIVWDLDGNVLSETP